MLKKMLKYDMKAIFKFWWIGAVVCLAGGVLDGFCQRELYAANSDNYLLQNAAGLIQGLIYTSYVIFILLTLVLFFIRFYKNFFTDEGYLTFTLPVARKDLLNSKLLSGFIAMISAVGVLMTAIVLSSIIYSIGMPPEETPMEPEYIDPYWYFGLIYGAEAIILDVLIIALTVIFMGFCITFGSTIVKKGKLFASIGIYYGATSTVVTLLEVALILSLSSFMYTELPEDPGYLLVALMLLAVIFFIAMLCALFYTLQYRLLERKLNLS